MNQGETSQGKRRVNGHPKARRLGPPLKTLLTIWAFCPTAWQHRGYCGRISPAIRTGADGMTYAKFAG